MCGIVGIVANPNVNVVADILQCLKKLEYRGYDSAGVAVWDKSHGLQCLKIVGKVDDLIEKEKSKPLFGHIAIAHTRWATHGEPTKYNAHPQISHKQIAVAHNGIIENYAELKEHLLSLGYTFVSDTDTEIVAHLLHSYCNKGKGDGFLDVVHKTVSKLKGSFALAILNSWEPDKLIVVRCGSPLVVGLGQGDANYISSDVTSLLAHTNKFIYLEEGDIAVVEKDRVKVYDLALKPVAREEKISQLMPETVAKGGYSHYMLKEIYEQPFAIKDTLKEYTNDFWLKIGLKKLAHKIKRIQIVACGSSYYVGMVGKYWCETFAKIPCDVDVASEFRYRDVVVEEGTLFITISQSGETADTLAALRFAKEQQYFKRITICNVKESSLVRESDESLMTYAGMEMGVATSKAFTSQLVVLFLLLLQLAREKGLARTEYLDHLHYLQQLPFLVKQVLILDDKIHTLAKRFVDKEHVFYLGRGVSYPIALEGALKLKEISYLHAESFAAGELKHGPLALIDAKVPVVVLAPHDKLWGKVTSNIQEVLARGGEVVVVSDMERDSFDSRITVIKMPKVIAALIPILYVLPLQLLAYHVAVLRGNDVDQPRHLAKSVTVE